MSVTQSEGIVVCSVKASALSSPHGQCDEVQPACGRCVKAGAECVYRDTADIFFRNQTTEVAKRAQTKWRSRAKRPESDTSASDSTSESSSGESQRDAIITATLSLVPLREAQAHSRFFYDFVVPYDPAEHYSAFFGILPDLYQTSEPGSCFRNSLAAAAYSNFAGRHKSREVAIAGAQLYGKALTQMSMEMREQWSRNPIETMVSIGLLGFYEVGLPPFIAVQTARTVFIFFCFLSHSRWSTLILTPDTN